MIEQTASPASSSPPQSPAVQDVHRRGKKPTDLAAGAGPVAGAAAALLAPLVAAAAAAALLAVGAVARPVPQPPALQKNWFVFGVLIQTSLTVLQPVPPCPRILRALPPCLFSFVLLNKKGPRLKQSPARCPSSIHTAEPSVAMLKLAWERSSAAAHALPKLGAVSLSVPSSRCDL